MAEVSPEMPTVRADEDLRVQDAVLGKTDVVMIGAQSQNVMLANGLAFGDWCVDALAAF